ncbi:hypothetical protein HMPREF0027_0249 [Actinobacillus ureae ATCC 25976]|uniref:Uncharacterized protein n=1 Tax=Actinobacillus ureae ATCC 25976 TaxID=887324 RepID=E8KEI2_9PAST|nr:hypothetical protein HMPREF0027_0249 [Actinobacillus ureae ATCC 25976]
MIRFRFLTKALDDNKKTEFPTEKSAFSQPLVTIMDFDINLKLLHTK